MSTLQEAERQERMINALERIATSLESLDRKTPQSDGWPNVTTYGWAIPNSGTAIPYVPSTVIISAGDANAK